MVERRRILFTDACYVDKRCHARAGLSEYATGSHVTYVTTASARNVADARARYDITLLR